MSLTVTAIHNPDSSHNAGGVFDITFDNSYPANGYPVGGSTFGRKAIHSLVPSVKGTVSRLISYDPTTSGGGTLRVWTAIGTEAVTSSDQSSISCRCRVVGPVA